MAVDTLLLVPRPPDIDLADPRFFFNGDAEPQWSAGNELLAPFRKFAEVSTDSAISEPTESAMGCVPVLLELAGAACPTRQGGVHEGKLRARCAQLRLELCPPVVLRL
jgi:hypothetical protein